MNAATQSILQSVKIYSLVPEETTIYDAPITLLINSQFNTLKQLGVGPLNGFHITGAGEVWSDTGIEEPLLSAVTDYVKIAVNLKFDPPTNSFLVKLKQDQLDELTWRITNDWSTVEET